MIRARESHDRWAVAAHEILDDARDNAAVLGRHVTWALIYLGDKSGDATVPSDLLRGYDASKAAERTAPRFQSC